MARAVKRVALVMHRWVGYLAGIQLGVADYFVQRPDWIWTHVLPEPHELESLNTMPVDGIIAYMEESYLDFLVSRRVPTVDISNWLQRAPFPQVLPDDVGIGRMAAEYLSDLGLRNIGFIGFGTVQFNKLRFKGFSEALAKVGVVPDVCSWNDQLPDGASITAPAGVNRGVLGWLLKLPKPVGVFGVNDKVAAEVLEICRAAGIRVPEEVCVLGVDNDELLTRVANPPLSSIALHAQKIGFEAARLLDSFMSGVEPPKKPILLPPERVVARQSTNLLAIEDADVVAAVRYIREHIHQHITVRHLLEAVPVNRRYLERKFKEALGRTPLQEIRRARLEKAKELLSNTDLSMPAVARRSGFPNPERLANVFHAMTGTTPTQFRRKFRLRDD
jgi:LacI family transcriptional regulator